MDGITLFRSNVWEILIEDFLEGMFCFGAHLRFACTKTCGKLGLGKKLSVEITVAHREMKNEEKDKGQVTKYKGLRTKYKGQRTRDKGLKKLET